MGDRVPPVSFGAPKLKKDNFVRWNKEMMSFLKMQDVWEVVQEEIEEVTKEEEEAMAAARRNSWNAKKIKEARAMFSIQQALGDDDFEKIADAKNSFNAWKIIQDSYRGDVRVREMKLQLLRGEFELLIMKDSETISDYFQRVLKIANGMKMNGEEIADVRMVQKILRSLPQRFDHVVAAIEESKNLNEVSCEELRSSLQVHEQLMNRRKESVVNQQQPVEVLNFTEANPGRAPQQGFQGGRGRGNFRGRGRGGRSNNNNEGRQQDDQSQAPNNPRGGPPNARGRGRFTRGGRGGRGFNGRNQIQCYTCNKFGHISTHCYQNNERYVTRPHNQNQGNPQNNLVVDGDQQQRSMSAMVDGDEEDKKSLWYLDSGASNHMTGRKELFLELEENINKEVTFGNNAVIQVKGVGRIPIKTMNYGVCNVENVFYVPGITSNILSLGQLLEKGYEIVMKDMMLTMIAEDKEVIARVAMKKNRLFLLNLNSERINYLSTVVNDENWLWHMRYGHLAFDTLKKLSKEDGVRGIPKMIEEPNHMCEACVLGKIHKQPFPKEAQWRAKRILQLVHSDVCGPITPTSLGGNKYFCTFIDDYSRKTWVYPMKAKSEVFENFKKFKALVENESGNYIQCLRSDNGGEYLSREFTDFLDHHGIRRQLTTPYTPQQNGVAERKNRTLHDMCRCMLRGKNLPKEFWGEAVLAACYVSNRCSTKALETGTPQEAWSGYKPSVSHLKVFGSIAYALKAGPMESKVEDRGRKLIFIGYDQKSKGYKLYDPIEKKNVISRNVIVDEAEEWDWNKGKEKEKVEEVPSTSDEDTSTNTTIPHCTEEDRPRVQRMRSIGDIYDVPNTNDDFSLFCLLADTEPLSYEEASHSSDWQNAMKEEIIAIQKNNTWDVAKLPSGKKPIGVKWVYKVKKDGDGKVVKYKARLVAKGYKQKEGINYDEVQLEHVKTLDQVADIFTKPLKVELFKRLREWLGLMKKEELSLGGSIVGNKL